MSANNGPAPEDLSYAAAKPEHQAARNAYVLKGMNAVQTGELVGKTRQTIYAWRDAGYANDGENWDETRDRLEEEGKVVLAEQGLDRASTAFRNTKEGARNFALRTLSIAARQMEADGFRNLNPTHVKQMLELVLNLDERQAYSAAWEAIREIGVVVAKSLQAHVKDERERQLVSIEVREALAALKTRFDKYAS